ncbi:MAG: hypothetical protein Q4C54_02045 [Clostridia bacterium]|nr:hypothetical protein [Clostridia bacterium]
MKRKEFLDLYQTVMVTDPKTGKQKRRAKYIGPYYETDMASKRKLVPLLWVLFVLQAAVYAVPGLMFSTMMTAWYVLVPYLICLLPMLYALMAMFEISTIKNPLTRVKLAEGPESAKNMTTASAVVGIIWLVCDIIFAFAGAFGATLASNIICMVCAAAFSGLNAMMAVKIRTMVITEKPQETEERHEGEA